MKGWHTINNLHRELAPIFPTARGSKIEQDAALTLNRYLAGRRAVDRQGPGGAILATVRIGHLHKIEAQGEGIVATDYHYHFKSKARSPYCR